MLSRGTAFRTPLPILIPQSDYIPNEVKTSVGTQDVAVADSLIAKIDEIAEIFWATKKA